MANLTGKPVFKPFIRQLETTDPKHPDTWNPNYQDLINNDAFLKQFADEVAQARGSKGSLGTRLSEVETTQESLDVAFQNAQTAALKFALDQAHQANHGVRALRDQAQQEGQIIIENRGIVSGCSVTKSTTAARNLNLVGGVCFGNGRAYSVTPGNNAASVPSNTGSGSVVVHAYLYLNSQNLWRLAVTPIGTPVPVGAITIYRLTIPAGSTDATDPNLINVSLTDVRRLEPNFPMMLDSPVAVMQAINMLSANDYVLGFDVLSYDGAPCDANHILTTSRAPNGFTITLASAADTVVVRWKASKLNN